MWVSIEMRIEDNTQFRMQVHTWVDVEIKSGVRIESNIGFGIDVNV